MRKLALLVLTVLLPAAAAVPDNDPTLVALRTLASQVEAQVHIPGYPTFAPPKVMLDGDTRISYLIPKDNSVHEAQFGDLPAPMQGIWNQWDSCTPDEPTGKALFEDQFYRFFFVHELGHWMAFKVIEGSPRARGPSLQRTKRDICGSERSQPIESP